MKNYVVSFARHDEEDELKDIFNVYGMDLAGTAEEHVILKADRQILAGSKIREVGEGCFFLEVLGVRDEKCHQGWGGALLREIIQNPWMYCASSNQRGDAYQLFTVSRGKAVSFYQRHGFEPCNFEAIPMLYQAQCVSCFERLECGPVPMILIGGKTK